MKEKHFFMTALVILVIILVATNTYKEGFLDSYCDQYKDCNDCANASGCSWCPTSKVCLKSTSLKSTDKSCNQMNTISSAFLCKSELSDKIPPKNAKADDLYDFELYRSQIADKVRPPNVYTNPDMEYSPETVMGNMNHLQHDLERDRTNLPTVIASTVQNQIRPMVHGILSDNYYIQA